VVVAVIILVPALVTWVEETAAGDQDTRCLPVPTALGEGTQPVEVVLVTVAVL